MCWNSCKAEFFCICHWVIHKKHPLQLKHEFSKKNTCIKPIRHHLQPTSNRYFALGPQKVSIEHRRGEGKDYSYSDDVLNALPSRRHRSMAACFPDTRVGITPPPGTTHWPAIKKLSRPGRVRFTLVVNILSMMAKPSKAPWRFRVKRHQVWGVATFVISTWSLIPGHTSFSRSNTCWPVISFSAL